MLDTLDKQATGDAQIATIRAGRTLRTEEMVLNMGPQHLRHTACSGSSWCSMESRSSM